MLLVAVVASFAVGPVAAASFAVGLDAAASSAAVVEGPASEDLSCQKASFRSLCWQPGANPLTIGELKKNIFAIKINNKLFWFNVTIVVYTLIVI